MNREEALMIWAPEDSPWSPWTKAVLFAFMAEETPDVSPALGRTCGVPLNKAAALIIELAGAAGVEFGISLATAGYRPVPLYNACPYPIDPARLRATAVGADALPACATYVRSAIDVVPILRALQRETKTLQSIDLLPSAPPAFLLDANRHRPALSPRVGWFDNRSVIRQSDVPTAAFLKAHGIEHVIVVQANLDLQSDLGAILLAWQEGGLSISKQVLTDAWNPTLFTVPRPSRLKAWWHKLLFRVGFPLNSAGSFGEFVHGSGG